MTRGLERADAIRAARYASGREGFLPGRTRGRAFLFCRLVAEVRDRIVANATLDRDAFGWTKHIGDLRVIVDDEYEKLGVRAALCEQFVAIAQAAGIERAQTEVLVERADLFLILERLGFTRELVRRAMRRALMASCTTRPS